MKQLYPDCNITVLTSASNDIIAKNHKSVDNTIIFNKTIIGYIKSFLQLRKTKFDYWIDTKPEHSNTSSKLLKIARFKKSIGFNFRATNFDLDLTPIRTGEHYTEINKLPLIFLNKRGDFTNLMPELFIPDEIRQKASEILKVYPKNYILFNLSVKDETRNWNPDDVVSIYKTFSGKLDFVFQFISKDRECFKNIESKTGRKLNYFDGGILELAEIVRNARLIITPDTSLVHIASCFNVPIVAVYHKVEWNIKRFAPLSDKKVILISTEENKISIDSGEVCAAISGMI
ncbi:MAG TPA: glycosyltransferase family 9 protein [Ignavibacteria bacterium]|nr:glycosyltransferase family 9 protein [Ignavibacteria bacterium]